MKVMAEVGTVLHHIFKFDGTKPEYCRQSDSDLWQLEGSANHLRPRSFLAKFTTVLVAS